MILNVILQQLTRPVVAWDSDRLIGKGRAMSFGKPTRSHRIKHKKIATGFVWAMLLVLGSGCDKGWVAYQQIEIGRPLSPDHLLLREGQSDGKGQIKAWGEFASSSIPPVLAWDSAGVLLDAEGNVVARRYVAVALGYWGLFQTITARSVMEVEVPPRPFGKLPPNSSTTRNPPTTLREYLELVEDSSVPVNLTQSQGDRLGACFASGTGMVFSASVEYAAACVSPFALCRLGGIIDEFPGAMNHGYDLRVRDDLGRCYSVRNLGGRRIRVESSWFRIIDFGGLAMGIRLPPHVTVDTGVEEKQTKAKIEPDEGNH